jgi:hypothetical protein
VILKKFSLLTLGLLILCPTKNWGQKINGLSFVGTRINVNKEHIDPVKETAVNWVALMPYGYMNSAQDSSIKFDLSWQWFGETKSGINQTVPFFIMMGLKLCSNLIFGFEVDFLEAQEHLNLILPRVNSKNPIKS